MAQAELMGPVLCGLQLDRQLYDSCFLFHPVKEVWVGIVDGSLCVNKHEEAPLTFKAYMYQTLNSRETCIITKCRGCRTGECFAALPVA
jgi:hypothetical protein